MEINKRVERLEAIVESLSKEVSNLRQQIESNEKTDWKNNRIDDYMIKLFYPGVYEIVDEPIAGFPKNKKRLTEKIYPGQYMFIYVASPVKKIIGLAKVTSTVKEIIDSIWPYYVELEWIIKPRSGVSFKDCGLNIRPRPGDTVFAINKDIAQNIIEKLKAQDELDESTLKYLANEYKDSYKRK